jgi:hypothetical protein
MKKPKLSKEAIQFCDECMDDIKGTCDYSVKTNKCKYETIIKELNKSK